MEATEKKAHIQIPRLILKNFHDEKATLYYYDFNESRVKLGHAKTMYAEDGYYSKYVEKFWGDKVESPLGTLIKFLKETTFVDGENPSINARELAFCYLYSLLARSPKLQEKINEHSVFFRLLSEKVEKNSIAAHDSYWCAKELGLLSDYQVAYLANLTSEQLMLPSGGIIQYGKRLICPVSPLRAIVFDTVDQNENNEDESKSYVGVYEITSEEEMHQINIAAYLQEKKHNNKYLFSNNKQQLEELVIDAKDK